jgi:hypothetical protein
MPLRVASEKIGKLARFLAEPSRIYVKHFDERLVFSHLSATPMQRMMALAEEQPEQASFPAG